MADQPGFWWVSTWGRTQLRTHDDEIALRPKERALVAALAFAHPAPSRTVALAELIWGDAVPRTYDKSIQNHVARIRRVAPGLIETVDHGYRLYPAVEVSSQPVDGLPGPGFGDLADAPEVTARRDLVRAQAEQAENAKLRDLVGVGDGDVVVRLRESIAERPLSEFRRSLLARSLAQHGQRRDALLAIDDARDAFREAGLQIGESLADLERRLFDADPTLLSTRPAAPAVASNERIRRRNEHVVGHQNYLDRVRPVLERTGTAAHTVSLVGDPGTGKTTIAGCIRDFAEQNGFTTYSATCSAEPSVPLEPFRELLRQIHERYPEQLFRSDGAEFLVAIDPSLGRHDHTDSETGNVDRDSLFDAVAEAVRCSPRPALIVLEDLHRASPGTLRLLQRCQRSDGASRLVLVQTSRSDLGSVAGHGQIVSVEPWTPAEVALYVARFGQNDAWTAAAASWISAQTDGVALHVRELTLEALNHTRFDSEHFVPPSTVPENLVAHLDRQLRQLTPSTIRILEAAATLGRSFGIDALESIVPDSMTGLEEASAAHVVERLPDGQRYEFRHDLFQRVVAEATPTGARVELHDLAARVCERAGAEPVVVARHALAAAALDPGRAIRSALVAAESYAAKHEYEQAAELSLQARELAPRDGRQWCEATVLAGNMWMRLGDEKAWNYLRSAAEAAIALGDQLLVARTISELCRLGLSSVISQVDEDTGHLLDAALEMTTDDIPRSLTATAAAQVYATSGQAETSRSYFLEALACARAAADADTIQNVLGAAVVTMHEPDDLGMREAAVSELSEIASRSGSPEVLWSAAHLRLSNQLQCGDPAMRDTLVEMENLASTLRQRTRWWELTYWQATMALVDGDFERAEALADATLDYSDAIADSLLSASYGGLLLGIRCAADRGHELHELISGLVQDQKAIGGWHAALAFTAAVAGDRDLAAKTARRVAADDCAMLSRDFTYSGAVCLLGRAAAMVEDEDTCRTVSRLLAPWAGRWAWVGTCTLGPVDLVRARVAEACGDRAEAQALAAKAVAQCTMAGAPAYGAEAAAFAAGL